MFTPHVDCSRATMAGVFFVLHIQLLEPRNEVLQLSSSPAKEIVPAYSEVRCYTCLGALNVWATFPLYPGCVQSHGRCLNNEFTSTYIGHGLNCCSTEILL